MDVVSAGKCCELAVQGTMGQVMRGLTESERSGGVKSHETERAIRLKGPAGSGLHRPPDYTDRTSLTVCDPAIEKHPICIVRSCSLWLQLRVKVQMSVKQKLYNFFFLP